ncbi:MAG TPA: hypothetical protein VI727_10995 [Candidatus Brocadiaceae bacterium]|nr:hypothetical protein [Candidatus Brocadiaceae bacterium]
MLLHNFYFVIPQTHTNRGISFETIITGIHRALVDAPQRLVITSKLLYPDITKETREGTKERLLRIPSIRVH